MFLTASKYYPVLLVTDELPKNQNTPFFFSLFQLYYWNTLRWKSGVTILPNTDIDTFFISGCIGVSGKTDLGSLIL